MKPETLITLLLFALIVVLLTTFKYDLDHFCPQLASEVALWGFGVASTCCAQALLFGMVAAQETTAPSPRAVAAKLLLAYLKNQRTIQWLLCTFSLGVWVFVLQMDCKICRPEPVSILFMTSMAWLGAGLAIGIAFLALEIK